MALGLRSWIGLVAAGSVTLGAIALPVKPPRGGDYAQLRTPERRRADELSVELSTLNETVRRMRWSDSLSALTVGAAELEIPVMVGAPTDVDSRWFTPGAQGPNDRPPEPAELARFRERVNAELVQLGASSPAVDVGVFLVSGRTAAATEAVYPLHTLRVEWYAGQRDGRSYCITLRMSSMPTVADLTSGPWETGPRRDGGRILGPCGFYARYGLPGADIGRWMQDVGASLATDRGRIGVGEPIDLAWRERFGWQPSRYPGDLHVNACLRGVAASCVRVMHEERPQMRDPMEEAEPYVIAAGVPILDGAIAHGGGASTGDIASSRMLDGIERRFGQEAFARFWHSQRPFDEAFTEAFGMTPEEWATVWVESLYPKPMRADVLPGASEAGLSLLYLGLAVVLGVGMVRSRKLG